MRFTLALCVYLCAESIAQNVFYVDSELGSDFNSGASPENALSSLERAAAAANSNTGIAGVTLRLVRGGIWLNDPLLVAKKDGGPITVESYGPTSLPHPLLQQSRGLSDAGGTPCLHITAPKATSSSVRGLHFSGCGRGVVIAGNADPTAPLANVAITGNIFQDIRTPFLRYSPPNPAWAPAILLDGGHFSNLTVKNNAAVRIDVFFQSNANTTTMHLDANTVSECSGNCYGFGLGVGLIMSNSVLLRDMSTRPTPQLQLQLLPQAQPSAASSSSSSSSS